jgi:DNA-binding CsgD family transcriptional regulator
MMNLQDMYSFDDINDFLINCGNSDDPHELSVKIIEGMNKIIPYDQARIYFLDQKGAVSGEILSGVDKRWLNAYKDYYSQILDGRYSISSRLRQNNYHFAKSVENNMLDYTACSGDEFVNDYIRPQKIFYNLSFALSDQHGIIRKLIMFDRTNKVKYSQRDLEIFATILPHLKNLHKNYYIQPQQDGHYWLDDQDSASMLTKREAEVAMMVYEGFTPEKIAQGLFVSRTTVYKHIAHIHEKLNVSNRQELILKLFHMKMIDQQQTAPPQ